VSEPTQNDGLSIKHTYMAFFVVFVAFAHEYGYWSEFHIHLLEHIGLADLPKLAVWPVVATAGAYVLGSIIGLVTSKPSVYSPGSGANAPTGTVLNRYRRPIGLFLVTCGLLSYSVLWVSENVWAVGPLLITFGLLIAVDIPPLMERIGIKLSFSIALMLVFLPCLAFGIGHSEALKIIDGTNYVGARFMNSGPALRYLGRAGDYVSFGIPTI
jgi:hypothetical protein